MKDWKDTTERYIAFIDIMGFKNYVYRNSHEIVKKRMLVLQSIIDDTEREIETMSREFATIENPIKTVIFSDSVLIITKNNSPNCLDFILFACQILLCKSFENQIPMKGAISYGTITSDFNKSLFFGKALIDAYTLEEQLFIYGIALDDKVEKKIKKLNYLEKSYCKKARIVTKSGAITHQIINWMNWINQNKDNRTTDKLEATKIMENFYEDMSGYPRKYVDNTIDCINLCCI